MRAPFARIVLLRAACFDTRLEPQAVASVMPLPKAPKPAQVAPVASRSQFAMAGQRKATKGQAGSVAGKGGAKRGKATEAKDTAPEKKRRITRSEPSRSTCSICGCVADSAGQVARRCPPPGSDPTSLVCAHVGMPQRGIRQHIRLVPT